jgi:hypothetical protein
MASLDADETEPYLCLLDHLCPALLPVLPDFFERLYRAQSLAGDAPHYDILA